MANEVVGVDVVINGGDAVKSVGSLRSQIKEALGNLTEVQERFGDISPEAQKAAQSVAELRDRLKDANEVASLFDPEKKFQAVIGVAQGIASGFAAAQGAMALFGAESEDVEKAILKVQAAMSLAQGLSGIKAATEDFQRLFAVIKSISVVQTLYNFVMNGTAVATTAATAATTGWTIALRVLRGALVSTGIGAIVVLIGTMISQIIELTDSTEKYAEALDKADKETQDFANSTSDAIVETIRQAGEMAEARARAEGASAKEIEAIQKETLAKIKRERDANVQNQKNDLLDVTEANKKAAEAEREVKLTSLNNQAKDREAAAAKQKEADAKSRQEKQKADDAAKIAAKQREEDLQGLGKLFLDNAQTADQTEIELEANRKARAESTIAYGWQIASENYNAQQEQTAKEKAESDKRKELAQREKEAKIAGVMAVAGALNSFSQLAGEQTVAGKAFAVASATIQAILGAQQAFTSLSAIPIVGPALGAVAAAGAIAAGIANVKKILAVQIPGQTSTGSGSAPSISSNVAPIIPLRPQISTVQIDQKSVNERGDATVVRAYVVEADITDAQKRANRIQEAAKFR